MLRSLPSSLSRRARGGLFVIATLCAALVLSATAPCAYAADPEDDPEVVAQAKEHYKAGLEAYKAGKYDVAIRELKKAYLLKRLPPLLLNIGATYRKMGDLDLSLHFYQKYLDEAPSDAKDRPEVEKIIAEIKQQKTEAPAADAETAPPPKQQPQEDSGSRRGGGVEWNHNIIDAAPPETAIDVRVTTPVMKGVKVYVYYRTAGQADFTGVLMKRRNNKEKVGRIPAEAVTGRSMQYYIEAKDSAGTVVKSAGNQSNPNIIMIEEGVKPVTVASANREEPEEQADDEEKPKKAKAARNLDDEEAPPTGVGTVREEKPRPTRRKKAGVAVARTLLQTLGYSFLGIGGLGVLGGATFLGLAHREAGIVQDDSNLAKAGTAGMIFFNNDPTVTTQDADHQSRGKLYNNIGIGLAAVGGVAAAAGASCLIADAIIKSSDRSAPVKKKKHKKRRRVEEDEEEETRNWYVAPSVGPSAAMVSGGFSF